MSHNSNSLIGETSSSVYSQRSVSVAEKRNKFISVRLKYTEINNLLDDYNDNYIEKFLKATEKNINKSFTSIKVKLMKSNDLFDDYQDKYIEEFFKKATFIIYSTLSIGVIIGKTVSFRPIAQYIYYYSIIGSSSGIAIGGTAIFLAKCHEYIKDEYVAKTSPALKKVSTDLIPNNQSLYTNNTEDRDFSLNLKTTSNSSSFNDNINSFVKATLISSAMTACYSMVGGALSFSFVGQGMLFSGIMLTSSSIVTRGTVILVNNCHKCIDKYIDGYADYYIKGDYNSDPLLQERKVDPLLTTTNNIEDVTQSRPSEEDRSGLFIKLKSTELFKYMHSKRFYWPEKSVNKLVKEAIVVIYPALSLGVIIGETVSFRPIAQYISCLSVIGAASGIVLGGSAIFSIKYHEYMNDESLTSNDIGDIESNLHLKTRQNSKLFNGFLAAAATFSASSSLYALVGGALSFSFVGQSMLFTGIISSSSSAVAGGTAILVNNCHKYIDKYIDGYADYYIKGDYNSEYLSEDVEGDLDIELKSAKGIIKEWDDSLRKLPSMSALEEPSSNLRHDMDERGSDAKLATTMPNSNLSNDSMKAPVIFSPASAMDEIIDVKKGSFASGYFIYEYVNKSLNKIIKATVFYSSAAAIGVIIGKRFSFGYVLSCSVNGIAISSLAGGSVIILDNWYNSLGVYVENNSEDAIAKTSKDVSSDDKEVNEVEDIDSDIDLETNSNLSNCAFDEFLKATLVCSYTSIVISSSISTLLSCDTDGEVNNSLSCESICNATLVGVCSSALIGGAAVLANTCKDYVDSCIDEYADDYLQADEYYR